MPEFLSKLENIQKVLYERSEIGLQKIRVL
jgi:hypothetical protein